MSVSAEQAIEVLHRDAVEARKVVTEATERERLATVAFMDEAKRQGWSWGRIGPSLGVTDVAARRYYERNRRRVNARAAA